MVGLDSRLGGTVQAVVSPHNTSQPTTRRPADPPGGHLVVQQGSVTTHAPMAGHVLQLG